MARSSAAGRARGMGRSGPMSLPGGKVGLTLRSGWERLRAAHRAVVLIRDELAPLGARQLAARHATGVVRPGVGVDLSALGIAAVTEHEELDPDDDPAVDTGRV